MSSPKPENQERQLVIAFLALFLRKEDALALYNRLSHKRAFWRRLLYLTHHSKARFPGEWPLPELSSTTSKKLCQLFSTWINEEDSTLGLETVFSACSSSLVHRVAVHVQTCFTARDSEDVSVSTVLNMTEFEGDGAPEFLRALLALCYANIYGAELPEFYLDIWTAKGSSQMDRLIARIWERFQKPLAADNL